MAASEGVDLEWAIVEYCRIKNNKQNHKTRNYSSKINIQANKCVEHVFKKFGNNFDIYHSDENVPGIGSISAKPEPKTDICIFSKNKKYFVSVKMSGGIQLASGQGESTADLFESSEEHLKSSNARKVLISIVNEVRTMPTRLLSGKNFNRIIEEGNSKIINEFIKEGKIIDDKKYEYWLQNNKPNLLSSLLSFVDDNQEYFESMLYEAMTGEKTLSSYKGAVANSILSPSGFYDIDESYIKKIKQKVKIDLRAKSRGGISSIAFRIETKGSV